MKDFHCLTESSLENSVTDPQRFYEIKSTKTQHLLKKKKIVNF